MENSSGQVTIRMFGVTEVRETFLLTSFSNYSLTKVEQAGHSVLAHVTQFPPYFYIAVPRGFTNDDVSAFRSYLEVRTSNIVI